MRWLISIALVLVPLAASAADAGPLWSVEVAPDGNVPKADLDKAAGALRAGLRATGKIVAPDAKSAGKHLVAHLSENGDEFALRIDALSPSDAGVAVTGPRVLLDDGAKRAAVRVASPLAKIAIPPDAHGDWLVDGKKVMPEAGTALVVAPGAHAVRYTSGAATAVAVVDAAGGETTPFPRAALDAAGARTTGPIARTEEPRPAPPTAAAPAHHVSKWVWIGGGAAAILAAGAVAAAAQPSGGGTTTVPGGPGNSTVTLHPN